MKLLIGLAASAALVSAAGARAQGEDILLPADFKGQIVYSGTHGGEVTWRGPVSRLLNVREVGSADDIVSRPRGTYAIELDYDGSAVRGRYRGTGGIRSGTVSGTRNGAFCTLVDDRDGTVIKAECTRTYFAGFALVNQPDVRMAMHMRTEAVPSARTAPRGDGPTR